MLIGRITVGSARDVSFLIDFLPAFLYPNGERSIQHWLVAGLSLGGHSTWITLRNGECIRILRSPSCFKVTTLGHKTLACELASRLLVSQSLRSVYQNTDTALMIIQVVPTTYL